jgi:hypothetical protein
VLPNDVVGHTLVLRRALKEEREQFREHGPIVSSAG